MTDSDTVTCAECLATVPFAQMSAGTKYRKCKACWRAYQKQWRDSHLERCRETQREWRRNNPEVGRRYYERNREAYLNRGREKRKRNPERYREYVRRSYRKHIEKRRAAAKKYNDGRKHTRRAYLEANMGRVRDYHRRYHLKTTFGIEMEDYEALLAAQGAVCAICGAPPPEKAVRGDGPGRLAVDHNHESGVVRGLLCLPCNAALARMEDIPQWHEKALAYLQRYSHPRKTA